MSGRLSDEHSSLIEYQLSTNNPFKMRAEIRKREDAFWAKREQLIKEEQHESLASEQKPKKRRVS
ncbi:hypothetical protein [Rubritalea sp.]|uniref:hypothetical protein n=1 Tax=Rubritalea sp. TaxID=2109375 RepID=UPI00324214DD